MSIPIQQFTVLVNDLAVVHLHQERQHHKLNQSWGMMYAPTWKPHLMPLQLRSQPCSGSSFVRKCLINVLVERCQAFPAQTHT